MSDLFVLPDVNLLLAYGWRSHAQHEECRLWLARLPKFATCAITELGFLRVSMSPAYRASFADAMKTLVSLTSQPTASFLGCDLPTRSMSSVSSYKDTTDSYLTELARKSSCRFATLDESMLKAPWAKGVAFHPFHD
jgi:predicted nucleic acid-binding protein